MALFESKKGAAKEGGTAKPANAAATRWRKKAEEVGDKNKRLAARTRADRRHLKRVAHHGGQAATTLVVANASSYAEGRWGREKMELGGYDMRKPVGAGLMLVGLAMEGLSKESSGSEAAGGYLTGAGLGVLTASTCSDSLRAGQRARSESDAKKPAADKASAPPSKAPGNEAALLEELRATPEKAGTAQGDRRGRQKRRIQPDHGAREMPPHLRAMLARKKAHSRAA